MKKLYARVLFAIGMWCQRHAGGGQALPDRVVIGAADLRSLESEKRLAVKA